MGHNIRELLDTDGENRAVRSFLMQYGVPSLTIGAMRQHMARSGWGAEYCPDFVNNSTATAGEHLTKAGAQIWIRHLFGMECTTGSEKYLRIALADAVEKVDRLSAEVMGYRHPLAQGKDSEDAARYRYIRETYPKGTMSDRCYNSTEASDLDSAIDAARASTEGKK